MTKTSVGRTVVYEMVPSCPIPIQQSYLLLGKPLLFYPDRWVPSKSNHSHMCHDHQERHLKQTLLPAADLFAPKAPVLANGFSKWHDSKLRYTRVNLRCATDIEASITLRGAWRGAWRECLYPPCGPRQDQLFLTHPWQGAVGSPLRNLPSRSSQHLPVLAVGSCGWGWKAASGSWIWISGGLLVNGRCYALPPALLLTVEVQQGFGGDRRGGQH